MTAKQRLLTILVCLWIAFPALLDWVAAHPQPVALAVAVALAGGPVLRALRGPTRRARAYSQ